MNTNGASPNSSITVGPYEFGKRHVTANCHGQTFKDHFDTESAFQRSAFATRIIEGMGRPESEREAIENCLVASCNARDEREKQSPLSIPKVITLSSVTPRDVEWRWEHRFPVGALVNISGNAGLGKSQLLTDIAARETKGWGMPPGHAPDGTFTPSDVLILSAEDDPECTIAPRFLAAGGNLDRIHLLRAVTIVGDDEERAIALPFDVAAIKQVVTEKKCGLVIVDPYESHVADNTNTNSNTDNRKCLGPLARMAEETRATVCIVQHLNKKAGLAAIHRAAGSVAIVAAARAAFVVAADPEDHQSRILACVKSNLGPMPKSIRFSIEQCGATSRVVWGDTSDHTADDILGGSGQRGGSSKLEQAKDIIADILGAGPRGENEVKQACLGEGISFSTYKRARQQLKVRSEKTDFDGEWMLTLPGLEGGDHADF